MVRTFRIIGIGLVIILTCALSFSAETITIDTYYPSPYGSYKELRARRMAIGNTYYGPTFCWSPASCANVVSAQVDLMVEGNVGIGTTNPLGPLQVLASSGVGFLVTDNGRVGIGTANPNSAAKLDVRSADKGFLPPRLTTAQRESIASPPAGLMIYNSETNGMEYYNGSAWLELGGEGGSDQLLGILSKFGSYTLTNTSDAQKVYTWQTSSLLNTCRSAGDLYGCRVDDGTGSYAIEINLSSFGRGLYTIEWGGDISVDAQDGRGMSLFLQSQSPSGSWFTLDTTPLFEDTDTDFTNPEPDSFYTNYTIETRVVTLTMSRRNWQRFRIVARKNGGDTRVNGWVGATTFIQIYRAGTI